MLMFSGEAGATPNSPPRNFQSIQALAAYCRHLLLSHLLHLRLACPRKKRYTSTPPQRANDDGNLPAGRVERQFVCSKHPVPGGLVCEAKETSLKSSRTNHRCKCVGYPPRRGHDSNTCCVLSLDGRAQTWSVDGSPHIPSTSQAGFRSGNDTAKKTVALDPGSRECA